MLDFLDSFISAVNVATAQAISWLLGAVSALGAGELVLKRALDQEQQTEQTKWERLIQFLSFQWLLGAGGLLGKLMNVLQRLHDWLQKHIGPIIEYIKQLQKWWDTYYRKYVLPVINMIQKVRRYLLILRLLHIHIADRLDQWLAKYEATLNKVNLTVHGYLNLLLNWASLASNPVTLGRLVLVSVTGRRIAAGITRAITGLPIGHFFPSTSPKAFAFERRPQSAADYRSEVTNPPASQILAPLLSFAGTGEVDDQVAVTDQDIDAAEPLPWGEEFISSLEKAEEFVAGSSPDSLSIVQLLVNQDGMLYDAGTGAAQSMMSVWGV